MKSKKPGTLHKKTLEANSLFMRATKSSIVIHALILIIAIGIFIIDLLTPLGMAEWLGYFLPLIIASRISQRPYMYVLAAICTALIALGFIYSPTGIEPEIALFNRSLAVGVIWMTAILLVQRKETENALQKAKDELDIRVRERTAGLANANRVLQAEIAERKQAEEALRESEEKYRTIIETASEGIWISDTEGRTTFVNKRMAEMIGYSPEEIIGKLAYDFMDEKARALGKLNLERRRQGLRESFEQKYIRKDGLTLWALVSRF